MAAATGRWFRAQMAGARERAGRLGGVGMPRHQERSPREGTATPTSVPAGGAADKGGEVDDGREVDDRWVACLHAARWDEGPVLTLCGWAYLKGAATPDGARIVVEFRDEETGRVEEVDAQLRVNAVANHAAADEFDHSGTAFEVRIDPRRFIDPSESDARARLRATVKVCAPSGDLSGPFTTRNGGGSAGAIPAMPIGGGLHVLPRWNAETGLTIHVVVYPAFVVRAESVAGQLQLEVEMTPGFSPVRAFVRRPDADLVDVPLEAVEPGRCVVVLPDPGADLDAQGEHFIGIADDTGLRRRLRWGGEAGIRIAVHRTCWLEARRDATVILTCDPGPLTITEVIHGPDPELGIEVRGMLTDASMGVESMLLRSRRTTVQAVGIAVDADGRLRAKFPLEAPAWGGAPRPLPAGRYRLVIRTRSGELGEPRLSLTCGGDLDEIQYTPWCNVRASRADDRLVVEIAAPLAPDELGTFHQMRLRAECSEAPEGGLTGTYLESWHGRTVADNPLAIYRELVRRGVGAPYAWGVQDLSAEVPESARALVVHSREWWLTMARCRHMVINFWPRAEVEKRDGQVLVQAWHGTPLKLLGLDRPSKAGRPDSIDVIERDTHLWDHLISQNPFSSEVFRRAYLWDRPILEVGYPRDDVLATDRGELRSVARRRLGVSDAVTTILYAPTWRENDRAQVGVLDLVEVAQELGSDFQVLVRGHSITLRSGISFESERLIDVTTYPDVADLMLAADILVTDYSSIMFDFSVTGRPILFYVPDWDDYASVTADNAPPGASGPDSAGRGVYFDVRSSAPGPVLTREADLVAAIRAHETWSANHADAYRRWRSTFNPWDDGNASHRVVDAVWGSRTGEAR